MTDPEQPVGLVQSGIEPWEYTVVVSIRNDRGEEIAHKIIDAGAMNPNQQRIFTLSVEAVSAKAKNPGKGATRH